LNNICLVKLSFLLIEVSSYTCNITL